MLNNRSIVRRFLLTGVVLFAVSCGESAQPPTQSEPAGPFAVPDESGPYLAGHTEDIVVDASRGGRELPVDIWYPIDDPGGAELTLYALQGDAGITSELAYRDAQPGAPGVRSLIVFSHGFGGINTQSVPLMEHLATHGFFVISPEHTGNINGDNSSPDPAADRVPDVTAVLDYMASRNATAGDPFEGRVNTQEVGVAGHSFGGFTATASATGYDVFGPDPRVVAIMPIAAANSRITDDELRGLDVPALFLCGTLDSLLDQQIRSFDLASSSPDLFRVDAIGASHTHFANICQIGNWLISIGIGKETWPSIGASALTGPYEATCEPPALPIETALRVQNLYAAAFFGRYLAGDERYAEYLTTDYASGSEPDVVFFTR